MSALLARSGCRARRVSSGEAGAARLLRLVCTALLVYFTACGGLLGLDDLTYAPPDATADANALDVTQGDDGSGGGGDAACTPCALDLATLDSCCLQ